MTPTDRERPSDGGLVKVMTRLTNGLARAMRMAAALQDITIEDAYCEAVTGYLYPQKNG